MWACGEIGIMAEVCGKTNCSPHCREIKEKEGLGSQCFFHRHAPMTRLLHLLVTLLAAEQAFNTWAFEGTLIQTIAVT
jgi:hypothetical protein